VKATKRKSKQKRTIKRKKRRELYDGDIVDPVVLYAGVSGGGEDEASCHGDTGGPIFDQESTRSKSWGYGLDQCDHTPVFKETLMLA
jgi:hypothetical protein